MQPPECRGGVGPWRTLTSAIRTLGTESLFLEYMMVMEVSETHLCNSNSLTHFSEGQEVALYVKKYYTKILTNLPSFRAKNYRLALEESFMKIDE